MTLLEQFWSNLDLMFDFVQARGPTGWVRMFWMYLAVDCPRYVLTAAVVVVLHLTRNRSRDRQASQWLNRTQPKVSVVVPVLNEEDTIAYTIRSLQTQSYPIYRIVLVDDGSTDRSAEICQQLVRQYGNVEFTTTGSRNGKSAALNQGLRFVRSEYVMFIDADCTFDFHAVERTLREFSDGRVAAVGGNLRVRNAATSMLTELQAIEYLTTLNVGRRWKGMLGVLPIVSGAFGLFRTALVRRVGGLDPGPGLDSDLTIDMAKLGGRVVFAADALCYTNGPTTWRALIKQRLRWNRNSVRNRWRKHADLFLPWRPHFRSLVALVHADNIVFQTWFLAMSLLYVCDVAIHFPRILPLLALVNYGLYALSETLSLLIAAALDPHPRRVLRSIVYVPLYHWYHWVLKLVLAIAQLQEIFFRASHRDPFAPLKVRLQMPRW